MFEYGELLSHHLAVHRQTRQTAVISAFVEVVIVDLSDGVRCTRRLLQR